MSMVDGASPHSDDLQVRLLNEPQCLKDNVFHLALSTSLVFLVYIIAGILARIQSIFIKKDLNASMLVDGLDYISEKNVMIR